MTAATPQQVQQLFTYPKEFTQLKYRPDRTGKSDTLLWLHSLPKEKGVVNAARPATDAAGNPLEGMEDDWIVIRKPLFLPPPPIPEELLPWAVGPLDDPQRPPSLRQSLQSQDAEGESQTLLLENKPEVSRAWQTYETRWQAWAWEERRAREVQRLYSQLFAVYQNLETFGETYELRLGLGYLVWQTPSGHEVRRHLLTARAALHFDATRGILSVTAAGDGARTALEQDMLAAQDRPLPAVQAAIAAELLEHGEELWSGEGLPGVLQTWVNAAGERGVYSAELKPPQTAGAQPTVHWAPALILRRRGERSLTAAFESITRQLPELTDIPDSARRFLGDRPPESPEPGTLDRTVYFPLPANDAQRQIIDRLRRQQGVLVQGPPGTGKSHTIVNLVSHLLATDQKVLVTSHTARALKVLREKFPPDLAALCVTHLRGEEGAGAALQGSVGEILQRHAGRQPWREQEQKELLHSALERARQKEDELLDQLQRVREAETGRIELPGYAGSAQDIGERLRTQEAELEWLEDYARPEAETPKTAPLDNAGAARLLILLRQLANVAPDDLTRRLPEPPSLPTPEEFLRLSEAEKAARREAQAHEQAHKQARSNAAYTVLEAAAVPVRARLLNSIQTLLASVETQRRQPLPWIGEAVEAVLKGSAGRWQDLNERSAALLPDLLKRADWLEQHTPAGTEGHDPQTLQNDAQAVLEHLRGGGNWGNFLFRPAAVKTRQYLREVRVAGRAAETPEVLQELLDALRLGTASEKLLDLWAAQGVQTGGPLRLQMTELDETRQVLERALGLRATLDAAQDAVRDVPGLPQPRWWDAPELLALGAAARAADAAGAVGAAQGALDTPLPVLKGIQASGQAHAVVELLSAAMLGRDAEAYGRAYLELQRLAAQQALFAEQNALLARLEAGSPALAQEFRSPGSDPPLTDSLWDTRLGNLEAAWNWLRADRELRRLADPDAELTVRADLAAVRQQQRDTLGQLAAVKAWRSALDRLTPDVQAALVRWQNAVRKVGKGTGKHASKWRRVAQQALEEAREAVPAWIMPIHLVAENFEITPNLFDVVIVDEASQAGPEALFLTFIAKKIIIVGDDKQIEPEGVGIKLDEIDALAQRYLKGLPAPEVVADVKASLFGFGTYTYPARISLREHFRCMPEIIKFSSDLSYPHEPLIALRQFGAERLPPLVDHPITDGYTRPSKSQKVNPPEARAIVDQIKACLADPRYAGKSMGVISLVGDAQAEEIAGLLGAEVSEAELAARNIICGNAYSFQGDERDVMFLSMVDSPSDGKRETMRARDNTTFQPRYNVAVSRARDQLWLFHSVDLTDLHPDDLRASLIRHVRDPQLRGVQPLLNAEVMTLRELAARPGRRPGGQPGPFDSWFEVDVYLELLERGYRVVPQYEMNGYRIDLVVEGQRGRLAVECDGDHWHGPEKYREDLARQQTLERAGMEFWRVRGSTFTRDPREALEDLWITLDRRGVFPDGDPRNSAPLEVRPTVTLPAPEAIPDWMEQPLPSEPLEDDTDEEKETPDNDSMDGEYLLSVPLQPYMSWTPRALPDPRATGNSRAIGAGLLEIIETEGPMTGLRAYQLYCQAADTRLTKTATRLLNGAVSQAIRTGQIVGNDEWGTADLLDRIVRVPSAPAVRLREAGPRKLIDVPPSELSALMDGLVAATPRLGAETPAALYRAALSVYGGQRLTEQARKVLEHARGLGEDSGIQG